MNAQFFSSRTEARNAANAGVGKFKDMGKDAPKGERWAVVMAQVTETLQAELPTATVEEVSGLPEGKTSKKDLAVALMAHLNAQAEGDRAKRSVIMAAFMTELGLTKAGAGTYYFNIKSGKWA